MARLVQHRWRAGGREGGIPQVGEVIVGAKGAWRVVEVRPIDSPIHDDDFRGYLQPIDWKPGDPFDRYYLNARERVFHGPWCAAVCRHLPKVAA